VPAVIAAAGEKASWRFAEFFTANIRNKNTRAPTPGRSAPSAGGATSADSNSCS
jgi:hypothetical protein